MAYFESKTADLAKVSQGCTTEDRTLDTYSLKLYQISPSSFLNENIHMYHVYRQIYFMHIIPLLHDFQWQKMCNSKHIENQLHSEQLWLSLWNLKFSLRDNLPPHSNSWTIMSCPPSFVIKTFPTFRTAVELLFRVDYNVWSDLICTEILSPHSGHLKSLNISVN